MRSIHTQEHVFRKVSEIDCPVDLVWDRVTTQEGINDEMGPYLKMTMPRQFRGRSIADVTPGTRIGKSFLLLFGILPFGFDDITIAKIDPGRMFREESIMTGMRIWFITAPWNRWGTRRSSPTRSRWLRRHRWA
ncbi:hypothetical protein BN970_05913 [Mycolicibacterium conceptionense]|uniref:Uncharacterized protein n=1 Tax=Mycolicibacterium conceptionense TaxID=451644 RepID=A0A0U1DVZ6_9MYCO|nr:hypothetical protein BN970_05913 [Mycolicibacterium conceptionense]